MNQNLSPLFEFDNIALNYANNSKTSSTIQYSRVNFCCCHINPAKTSSIKLTKGIDSLLLVPANILQSHSFASLPTEMILSYLIVEGCPSLLLFQWEQATLYDLNILLVIFFFFSKKGGVAVSFLFVPTSSSFDKQKPISTIRL